MREHDCCGQKIASFLEPEYHLRLAVPKIYEILAEKYVIRSKWRKNQKRGAVPKAACARAVIQMDTVLQTAMSQRFTGHVEVLQTDGGSEFKGVFAQQARTYCERHRIARPYKKNEQASIESFNRTLRKECWGWGTYRAQDLVRLIPEVHTFLERYHYHRPHLGFSPMRPPLQTPLPQEEELSDIYGE